MSAKKSNRSGAKGNYFSKGQEIRRCDDLRARIKAFCKQENLTHPEFATKLKVTSSQMANFMCGTSLTGSDVYDAGMRYLKMRMPLRKVPPGVRDNTVNDKWTVSFAG